MFSLVFEHDIHHKHSLFYEAQSMVKIIIPRDSHFCDLDENVCKFTRVAKLNRIRISLASRNINDVRLFNVNYST